MKRIWNERITLGWVERRVFCPAFYDRDYGRLNERVDDIIREIWLIADAHYDVNLHLVVIDLRPCENGESLAEHKRIMETVYPREAAIRSVIAHVDAFAEAIKAAIPAPDTRTDEQVKADWLAMKAEGGDKPLLKLAMSAYLGERCKFCGREYKTLADLDYTVFAGYHEHGRLACGECWNAHAQGA